MKVVQSISGDKSFIDFAITKDNVKADIYSISNSVLDKKNFKEKLDKYVTLTESDIPWSKIKIENGKQKVDKEFFDIISAFLTGSTRGRTDSTFEDNPHGDNGYDSKRPRMETIGITLSIDTRVTNDDEYKNMEELVRQIQENQQQRTDRFDEWGKSWESMTPEEIEDLNRRYEEEMQRELEMQIDDDPDYEPESSDSNSNSGSSDSTTDDESMDDDETLSGSEPESKLN